MRVWEEKAALLYVKQPNEPGQPISQRLKVRHSKGQMVSYEICSPPGPALGVHATEQATPRLFRLFEPLILEESGVGTETEKKGEGH